MTEPVNRDVGPGDPFVLGAHLDALGTKFSVYSESAETVDVCLFSEDGTEERIALPAKRGHVHHGHISGVGAGQRYGLRVTGPWDPTRGRFANPRQLLVDPYARAIEGEVTWGDAVFAHDVAHPKKPSQIDSAPHVPRCVVVDGSFDWGDDAHPRHSMNHSVVYETHVRGLTKLHPDVPEHLRGTYAGMAHPAIVEHLVALGVTAVELMPVHHFVSESFLHDKGLTNYWGYSTLGFFAPHGRYSSTGTRGEQVTEFKTLVKTFHAAGLEVILDVVYNHTAEGGPLGPTLSLRGLDNATYYRSDGSPGTYTDFTGTGNSLDFRHPAVQRLVMDSLRYWVQEMHVDGFRFDLAATLARQHGDPDPHAPLLAMIDQDPIVNRSKLIAEPWDVGHAGYQLGNFPPMWSEWNAAYRDDVRDFWRGADHSLRGFATRFTGSADLFDRQGRRPTASINFITAHDGFPLADLVSHDHRHNEANLEDNEDGHRHTRSWNGGIEGPTRNPVVIENRRRRVYSMLTTLLLSQGVPMLLGGDEIGRTQRGNNNAYCQDNELSWYDWANVDEDLLAYTRRLTALRRAHPVFRRRRFFQGRPAIGSSLDDIGWFTPQGAPMTHDDWHVDYARSVSVFLNGNALGPHDVVQSDDVGHSDAGSRDGGGEHGSGDGPDSVQAVDTNGSGRDATEDGIEHHTDRSFLFLCNSGEEPVVFTVPEGLGGQRWRVVLDTADAASRDDIVATSDEWKVGAWSVTLLERDRLVPEGS